MTTDGGGWTLVGRSAAGEWKLEFGWNWTTGALDNDDVPYALGAEAAELEVSEILFGSRMGGKTWGPDVYKAYAPDLYVFLYREVPYFGMVETVVGACTPEEGPYQLPPTTSLDGRRDPLPLHGEQLRRQHRTVPGRLQLRA